MSRVSKDYVLDTDPPLTLRVREKFDGILEGTKDEKWYGTNNSVRIEIDKCSTEIYPYLLIPVSLQSKFLIHEFLNREWGRCWNDNSCYRWEVISDCTFEEGVKYLENWIKENNLSLKEDKGKEIEPFTKTTDKDGITEIKSNTDPSVIFCINSLDGHPTSHNIWIRANQNGFIDLPDCFKNRPFLGVKLRDIWGTVEYSNNNIYRRMLSCDFDNPDTYEDRCSYIKNWIRDNIDGNKFKKEDCSTKIERLINEELYKEDIPREVNYSSLITRQCISESKLTPKPITFEERVVYLLKQLDEKIDRLEKKIDTWQEKI